MKLFEEEAKVLENDLVGLNLYLMSLYAPRTSESILPGQFVHMRLDSDPSHILRRPFSVYAADVQEGTIDILYQVVGEGTNIMSEWYPGDRTSLIAPIGNGWHIPTGTKRALLVGGGVGAAPLFMLCDELTSSGVSVDVVLGASTMDALVCRERYEELARPELRVSCATDDGSYGRPGFCTTLVEDALENAKLSDDAYDYLAVCGPEPLMKIVSKMAEDASLPCEVSLERRMACGIGACLSCVVETIDGKKRACVDGPVFNAEVLKW